VGRFTIEAGPEPREVNAFDPIEVTVKVRGQGVLSRIALPRWSAFPEITADFEIDSDVDPGEVVEDAKVFKVVLRARSSAVTALPALPLPYYDPWQRRYETARSDPVPLTVRDVKTVRPEDAVGAPVGPAPGPREPLGRLLGVGANFETLEETTGVLAASPPLLTPGFLVLLLAPPILAALLLLVDVRRSRPRDVPKGTPLSRAVAGLRAGPAADGSADLLAGYFRERLDLGAGEITTAEIERALTARSVDPALVARVVEVHDALVAARFAGGAGAPAGLEEVIREVDRCLG
jgi:hypothetical protein